MSNRDSLYDVSVSPPQHNSFTTPKGRNTIDSFVSRQTAADLWGASNERNAPLRRGVGGALPTRAPVANMTPTTTEPRSGYVGTPNSTRTSKGKSKRKGPHEYQAEADAVEEVRDRKDADWRGTQDTDKSEPSPKRKKKAPATENPPAIITPPMAKRGHKSYADSRADKKRIRDDRLAKITENWGEPQSWMPRCIWPCASSNSGESSHEQVLEDPRDWQPALLERLARLSDVLAKAPARAYQALEEAVRAANPKGRSPQICPNHVKQVIEQIELSGNAATPPCTPPHESLAERTGPTPEQPLLVATEPNEPTEAAPQLPTPRSATLGLTIRIKEECQPSTPSRRLASTEPARHGSRAGSREVDVISKNEWLRGREKEKILNKMEVNRLQQERLQLRQQLWALEDGDELAS